MGELQESDVLGRVGCGEVVGGLELPADVANFNLDGSEDSLMLSMRAVVLAFERLKREPDAVNLLLALDELSSKCLALLALLGQCIS